ncbi:hypothetical protein MASR2M78_09850 [Treponema sp.]
MVYDLFMTLSTRNRLLGTGIVSVLIPISYIAIHSIEIMGASPAASLEAERRSRGLIQSIARLFFNPSPLVPLVSIVFSVLFAICALALIFYYFEKTQAPEILFFSLFALSLAAESIRVVVPLAVAREWPPAYVVAAARALVFSRLFGLLSLFAAGVYATGIDYQKHGSVIIVIIAASLSIATGLPVDGLSWDSALSPINGYSIMLELSDIGFALITIFSFAVAAYNRGSTEFAHMAFGCLLVLLGRDGLMRADTWVCLSLGAASLVGGTWTIAGRVHRFYLWI